jgi:hypothetical protein
VARFDRPAVFAQLLVVVAARLADPNVHDDQRVRLRSLLTGRWRLVTPDSP